MSFSIYHNATNDRKYKAATGSDQAQFEELYSLFAPFYEPKSEQVHSQQTPPVLTDKREALFFILPYYKAYPTLQNMGTYFGFSDYAASTYLETLKPCLKAALQVQTREKQAIFRTQKSLTTCLLRWRTSSLMSLKYPSEGQSIRKFRKDIIAVK